MSFGQPICKMPPKYSSENGIIEFDGKEFIVNLEQMDLIMNLPHTFKFKTEDEIYPSYGVRGKRINYLDFLYKELLPNPKVHTHFFKNGNIYNLTPENVSAINIEFKNVLVEQGYTIDEQLARFEKKIADKYGKKEE